MHGASYDDVVEVEADDELEAALRREGYQLSRRELDALMEEREYAKFKAYVDRYAAEVGAQPALGTDEEGDDEDGGDRKKPKKSPLPRKPAKKPTKTATASDEPLDEDEADWV